MLIAAIISVMFFQVCLFSSEFLVLNKKKTMLEKQKIQVEQLFKDVQKKVEIESLTLAQAVEKNWTLEAGNFYIYIVNEFSNSLTEYQENRSYSFNDSFVHELNFSDVKGYIVITPLKGDMEANVYYFISGILSIFLFFIISSAMLAKVFSYIKIITEGIDKISKEDLRYKIPVKGENELSKLASCINKMGESLYLKNEFEKSIEIQQRTLITNLSHDLRTPLTSMIGYIGLIKKNTDENDKIYEYARIAQKNSLRLENLIDNLFMYAKLISNDVNMNLITVDINLFLTQIIEIQRIKVVFKPTKNKIYLKIDIDKFQRIMDNVFENIQKHGISNDIVFIQVIQDNKEVDIIVRNKTEENLIDKIELLTNRLYVGNAERKNGSSGLGLSIVSELTKHMNGSISIDFRNQYFILKLTFPKQL